MSRNGNYQKLFPKLLDADGGLICRLPSCGKKLPGKRQSFCSQDCTDKALIRCWPTEQRRQTLKRDKGICAQCGLDCIVAWKMINSAPFTPFAWIRENKGLTWVEAFLGIRISGNRHSFWDANHIIPVSEGGTNDLDNLETLCILCHQKHTKELRGRAAKARKASV